MADILATHFKRPSPGRSGHMACRMFLFVQHLFALVNCLGPFKLAAMPVADKILAKIRELGHVALSTSGFFRFGGTQRFTSRIMLASTVRERLGSQ